ncbi:MAG: methylenetetrahydrofolate reductase [NAD(P)H] [Candidatus Omnitrophica bacterium]|nr:methylenetetrahydrofolate reductase [NAD(P)H] [Candidatus Omnitrophota bacterium]
MKIKNLFPKKSLTYSFEFFPPKTPESYQKLLSTIAQLAELKPDFMTCTYGAGGGSRDKTLEIVEHIQKQHHIPGVAHLTCVCHTKDEIKNILEEMKRHGIENILALRGDPPKDQPNWTPGPENFQYSSELCAFIRRHFGDHFGIAVAGFPEGHVLCRDRELDAKYLKTKMDSGADFVITQLFFDNQDYASYVSRLRRLGVTARVIPGILPITDYQGLIKFCNMCGATVTDGVKKIFEPIQADKEKVHEEGIQFAIRQCQELLKMGAPGFHFYCLNKYEPVTTILKEVRKS